MKSKHSKGLISTKRDPEKIKHGNSKEACKEMNEKIVLYIPDFQ
jgi:hypothetical protein